MPEQESVTAPVSGSEPFSPGLLTHLPRPVHKVALVRASRLGDFICAGPAFRALRMALPDAEICMVTLPILADLADRSPYFDRTILFPGYPGLAEQFFDARRALAFFQAMQAERFDLAIQMQGSGVNSNPFTLMLGAKATVGFIRPEDTPGRLDAALPLPDTGHEIHRVRALTDFLGAPAQGDETCFPLWPEDRKAAETLLANVQAPLIGLHPTARDATRRWPPDRFAAAVAHLQESHGGTVVLLGEAEEQETARMVAAGILGSCLDLTGRTSLPVLGAVIDRLAVLITNDTGPAHIAYALGTPTVTIFGGGDPARYGPLIPGPFRVLAEPCQCRGLNRGDCPHGAPCLDAITVNAVLSASEGVIRLGTLPDVTA